MINENIIVTCTSYIKGGKKREKNLNLKIWIPKKF